MTGASAPGARVDRTLLRVWVAIALVALTVTLGAHRLAEPDEGRNAEVAREMAVTGDFLVPHLDGLPYLDKPALYFAADALAMRVFGFNEFAARLPSLLFGLGVIGLTAWLAAGAYGHRGAWIAGVATGASPLLVAFSRIVIFDTALAFFVVLALVAFLLAIEGRAGDGDGDPRAGKSRSSSWSLVAWAAMGLGVLTKGPVALLIPLLVAAPYAVWRRASRAVWRPSGLLAFAAVVAAWVVPVSLRRPELLHYALVVETFQRVATDELRRSGPLWYFVPILAAGTAPWSLVAMIGWRSLRREAVNGIDPRVVYFVLWIIVPFLFFSLSQSKRPQYVLPLVPAVALLVAYLWRRGDTALPGAKAAGIGLTVVGVVLIVVAAIPAARAQAPARLGEVIPVTVAALGFVTLISGALAVLWRRRWRMALIAFGLPVVALPLVGGPLLARVAAMRSSAGLARAIMAAGAEAEVVGVGAFPPSLAFYLRRTIVLSTVDGHELTSNYVRTYFDELRHRSGTPLRDADWWRGQIDSCETPMVFVARRQSEAEAALGRAGLPMIGTSRHYAAYGPCGAP